MTRAEAKEIMEGYTKPNGIGFPEVKEAIKTYLEQEPTEDCISRKEAISRIEEYIEEYDYTAPDGTHDLKWCAMMEAKMVLEELQPVQPKHGEWLYMPGMNQQCSECGEYFPVHELTVYRPFMVNYCPNCGADMRGIKRG